jgi:hypothetical protein
VAPLVVYWDADDRKDLLIGRSDGKVSVYFNTGTDDEPTFDGGTLIQVGPEGSQFDLDVGSRAVPTVVDWDNDGRKDLVIGALDGRISVFLNEGTDTAPEFLTRVFARTEAADIVVPSARSSPQVVDWDRDGTKDLITGNTEGQLLFYRNVGPDDAPLFVDSVLVESDGVAIDLPGTPRSRPDVCDWTQDGTLDVLIGSGDGLVRLYQGIRVVGDFDGDGEVDLSDFVIFEACVTGPGETPADCCEQRDLDADGDSDLADFAVFQQSISG